MFIAGIAGAILFIIIIFFSDIGLFGQGSFVKLLLFFGNQSPQGLVDSKPVESGVSFEQASLSVSLIGRPIRLKIPEINADAVIEYVGLTSSGAMDVPKNQDDIAWFNTGPRPGEIGSAVVAGHYGIKNGKGSVFDNLYKLREGDKIYIEDEKGATIVFVVRESRRYDPNADASDVFGSNDGKSHLNLVTCEGEWDKVAKTYSTRLVVFADKE